MLLHRVKYNIFSKGVQVPLALYMKLWVIDHTGKMGVKMEDFKVYLCVSPAETTQASQEGFPLCHMAYRIGKDFRLYRSGVGVNVRKGIMLLSNFGLEYTEIYSSILLHDIKRECDLRSYSGILCDFEKSADERLIRFLYEAENMFPDLGIDLYVPATYADHAPKSHVLISSAVTAGSFVESMSNAIERYPSQRIALYYDPICVDIVIPSPSGERTTITRSKLVELIREYRPLSYYSHELCSYYFTYRDNANSSHFVLYDDERSMVRKLETARRVGIKQAFILYEDVRQYIEKLKSFQSN